MYRRKVLATISVIHVETVNKIDWGCDEIVPSSHITPLQLRVVENHEEVM